MKWDENLIERALLIIDKYAFEYNYSEDFSTEVLTVTDCTDLTQKAIYLNVAGQYREKCMTFQSEKVRSEIDILVEANWVDIRDGVYD